MSKNRALKVNWFSPLPPAPTGIADYTAQIVPYLTSLADVTLWTDQSEWSPAIGSLAPVKRFRPGSVKPAELSDDSVSVYHIGNNGLHKAIWEVSMRFPGISVLHDTRLQHLFAYTIRDCYQDHGFYMQLMERLYGKKGRYAAKQFWVGGYTTEEMALKFPLARVGAGLSHRVVVHSAESRDILTNERFSEVSYLPFPYLCNRRPISRKPGPPYRIVICGYIGPNRRLDSFLRALAASPEKAAYTVDVYGPIWAPDYIKNIIREETGLSNQVSLHGEKPFAVLDQLLHGANLAANLRFPTMGEASMSQLQLWDHGIPSMVTPVGWYAGLPDGTTFPVRIDSEFDDILRHLKDFVHDPDSYYARGDFAREVLLAQHAPDRYAAAIVEMCNSSRDDNCRENMRELTDRVSGHIRNWWTDARDDSLLTNISQNISSVCGLDYRTDKSERKVR